MWIDCHCHTRYSYDNYLEPLVLVRRARELSLDGIVIAEHHSFDASAPVEHIGREEGLLVLRGVEISTDHGHLLAFGVVDDGWNIWGRDNHIPLLEVIAYINALGGICVPTHPFREVGSAGMLERLLDLGTVAAVETHNGGNVASDNDLALQATTTMQLPPLGGSDCHKKEAIGRCATGFSAEVVDMAGFIAAVRLGACRGDYYPGYRPA